MPLLEAAGAEVVVGGVNYFAALQAAMSAAEADPRAVLVPAYDHPTLWEGHSSMIDEVRDALPRDVKPDAVLCSVGGGGLLGGVITGCRRVGWEDGELTTASSRWGKRPLSFLSSSVPIVGLDTHGANAFYESMMANRSSAEVKTSSVAPASFTLDGTHDVHIAHLAGITSRAACLGATSPSAGVVRMALDREGPVRCVCMSDQMSLTSVLKFAGELAFVLIQCYIPDLNSTMSGTLSRRTQIPCRARVFDCSGPGVLPETAGIGRTQGGGNIPKETRSRVHRLRRRQRLSSGHGQLSQCQRG